MKLLIITQKVNRTDPILGFFHRWIEKFSELYEKITVICLEKGEYNLPPNTRVLSLGKENGQSRIKYLWRFYKHIWQERKNYDTVFVHMNQEYVLLGGKLWLLMGKKVFMWRNHHAGNWLTDIASLFCRKVFCTSRYSYTAKYKKTVLMPVGIDTNIFKPAPGITRHPNSILFLARIAPVKRPDLLLEALKILNDQGIEFRASLYGGPLLVDQQYFNLLKQRVASYGMLDKVKFQPGIPNDQTPAIYNRHEIFVNLSSSGMYDKTIFEAMACGCLVLVSNNNLKGQVDPRLIFEEGNLIDLTQKLRAVLTLSHIESKKLKIELRNYVFSEHSIVLLARKLFYVFHATF